MLAIALVVVSLGLGCSNSSGASSAATPAAKIEPCSLLSANDFLSALGSASTHPGKPDHMGYNGCDWDLANGASVSLDFYPAENGVLQDVPTRKRNDVTYTAIPGLGSEAVYEDESHPPLAISQLVDVKTASRYFQLQYVDAVTTRKASQEGLIQLTRAVVAHLH